MKQIIKEEMSDECKMTFFLMKKSLWEGEATPTPKTMANLILLSGRTYAKAPMPCSHLYGFTEEFIDYPPNIGLLAAGLEH